MSRSLDLIKSPESSVVSSGELSVPTLEGEILFWVRIKQDIRVKRSLILVGALQNLLDRLSKGLLFLGLLLSFGLYCQ